MISLRRSLLCFTAAGAIVLSGCHSTAAQRAVSPLIGAWQINGTQPQPDPNLPRFTRLRFERDGALDASYVTAGGALAGLVKSNPEVREERDTYTLVGAHGLRIIEGSRALDYRYEVRDDKLFLTGGGTDGTAVFAHVNPDD
jgi:hypothetical protein